MGWSSSQLPGHFLVRHQPPPLRSRKWVACTTPTRVSPVRRSRTSARLRAGSRPRPRRSRSTSSSSPARVSPLRRSASSSVTRTVSPRSSRSPVTRSSVSSRPPALPQIPEDLYCLIKKAVQVRKHLERNRHDKDSKFRLILIESRVHLLARYYRTKGQLPPTFKYESATASTMIA